MGTMNVQYPFVSEGPAETQVQQIKDYLYQLADQLNLQDFSAEKIFEEVSKAIDADVVADGSNEQASKLKEYANLKALIVKTGDYSLNHSEEFEKILKASYSASSDMGEFDEELVQTVKENAEGIERLFDYTAGINNEDGRWGVGTKQFVKTGLLYYDEGQVPVFGVGVGVINKIVAENDTVVDMSQNQLATYTADEMAFWDNGVKVGYISGKRFHLPAADIRGGSIHIGEEEHDFFKVDTSGNVQIGDYCSIDSAGLAKFQSADGKVAMDLSAGKITAIGTGIVNYSSEGITLENSVTGLVGKLSVEEASGNIIELTGKAAFNEFEVATNGLSKVCGGFYGHADGSSDLYTGKIYLRNIGNTDVLGEFAYDESTGLSHLFTNFVYVGNENFKTIVQLDKTTNGGLIRVGDELGKAVTELKAESWGVSCSIGKNGSLEALFDYDVDGRNVYADHYYFYGKSDGLVEYLGGSSANVNSSKYSAFIVIGKPVSSDYNVTLIIPSDETGDYQLASNEGFCGVSYTGSKISKTGTSTGGITAIYGIR